MRRAGYVLIGGRSSRMGRNKALLPFRDGTLGEFVAREVEQAAGNAVLVGGGHQAIGVGYPVTPDLYPGEGPLGGILTALQNTTADWNLIVACDMPGLSAKFLRGLLDAAENCSADALVPVGPSGYLEPLCAVYHRRSRQALYASFAEGVRQVAAALRGLRVQPFLVAEAVPFQNVNTPEEWAAYAPE